MRNPLNTSSLIASCLHGPHYADIISIPPDSVNTYPPLQDVDSVLSILSTISFLGGVPDAKREKIFRLLEAGSFRKGEYISRKGDVPSHIYIIKSGRVDLLISNDQVTSRKREFTLGDCFGEAALLSMNNNTASFVAAEDVEIIVLSRRALSQLRREDPDLFSMLLLNLARELARKLQFTDEILLRNHRGYELNAV